MGIHMGQSAFRVGSSGWGAVEKKYPATATNTTFRVNATAKSDAGYPLDSGDPNIL